jgi:hypothetical protein
MAIWQIMQDGNTPILGLVPHWQRVVDIPDGEYDDE